MIINLTSIYAIGVLSPFILNNHYFALGATNQVYKKNSKDLLVNISDSFSKESIDNFEKNVIELCKKNNIQYITSKYFDRFIGILSLFNNSNVIKDVKIWNDLIILILNDLIHVNFKNQDNSIDKNKFFGLLSKIINLMINTKVDNKLINVYINFYTLLFNVYIKINSNNNDDKIKRYSEIFDYLISNNDLLNLSNNLMQIISVNDKSKVDSDGNKTLISDEELMLSIIINLSNNFIYADNRYYDILEKYQDLLYDKTKEEIKPLGILILTIINRSDSVNYANYKFFADTIKEKIQTIAPSFKTGQIKKEEITNFCNFLLCVLSTMRST